MIHIISSRLNSTINSLNLIRDFFYFFDKDLIRELNESNLSLNLSL
jgi:hypothetical protein